MRKVIAFAGTTVSALTWAVIPAWASGGGDFDSSPESGSPGTVIHAVLDNATCEGRDEVLVVDLVSPHEELVASAHTTNNDGAWLLDLTVPNNASPGVYSVEARCESAAGEFRMDFDPNSFTVTGPPTTTTTVAPITTVPVTAAAVTTATTVKAAELPRTGSSSNAPLLIGLSSLTVGASLLVVRRRPRASRV